MPVSETSALRHGVSEIPVISRHVTGKTSFFGAMGQSGYGGRHNYKMRAVLCGSDDGNAYLTIILVMMQAVLCGGGSYWKPPEPCSWSPGRMDG